MNFSLALSILATILGLISEISPDSNLSHIFRSLACVWLGIALSMVIVRMM